jgi:hypothetical protein
MKIIRNGRLNAVLILFQEGNILNNHKFNTAVAKRYGVNAAIVAEQLWLAINTDKAFLHRGREWIRSSYAMLTVDLPFFSKNTVRRAVLKLIKNGVIIRAEINNSRFDRTYSYTFTDFGTHLMEANRYEE